MFLTMDDRDLDFTMEVRDFDLTTRDDSGTNFRLRFSCFVWVAVDAESGPVVFFVADNTVVNSCGIFCGAKDCMTIGSAGTDAPPHSSGD